MFDLAGVAGYASGACQPQKKGVGRVFLEMCITPRWKKTVLETVSRKREQPGERTFCASGAFQRCHVDSMSQSSTHLVCLVNRMPLKNNLGKWNPPYKLDNGHGHKLSQFHVSVRRMCIIDSAPCSYVSAKSVLLVASAQCCVAKWSLCAMQMRR